MSTKKKLYVAKGVEVIGIPDRQTREEVEYPFLANDDKDAPGEARILANEKGFSLQNVFRAWDNSYKKVPLN